MVLQGSLLGLAAAHARGVVHRDYKPDNVLVDADGASKLTDFGIAARAGDRSARGGTLAYAPPEQFAGEPASPAGDVYAATATFFECLTGRPPFRGDTAAALMYQHMSEPVPVDAVPEPLRPLVAAGMAKQPGDRPADAATFVAALSTVAAGAYGPRWHERGRSHLGEAALLLAALWPSGGQAAVQGTTVEKILLHRHRRLSRFRHASAGKKAIAAVIAVVIAVAGTVVAIGLTRSASHVVTLPAVTGVSPASGSTAGGNTVTITGTGLADATVVRFGRAAGTIIADSSTQITVTSPPSTGVVTTAAVTADSGTKMTAAGTGTVNITVTTRVGTSHVTAADHYTYTAPRPAVTGVSPGVGSTAGGTTVTITGTGLAGATGVRFGGAVASLTADSSTQVTVTSPPGTGTVTITVTTPAGTSKTTEGHYTYTTRPEPAQSISFSAPPRGRRAARRACRPPAAGRATRSCSPLIPPAARGCAPCPGPRSPTPRRAPASSTPTRPGTDTTRTHPRSSARSPSTRYPSRSPSSPRPRGRCAARRACRPPAVARATRSCSPPAARRCAPCPGSTVAYIAAGSCVIAANQAGNARYADAPQVQRTITVRKIPQSISFTAPLSGAVWSSALLSATGGGSGNPVVFSVDDASGAHVCHVSGTTVTYTAAGTCVIDANQARNDSYADAPQVQGKITVIRVPQYRGISSSFSQ